MVWHRAAGAGRGPVNDLDCVLGGGCSEDEGLVLILAISLLGDRVDAAAVLAAGATIGNGDEGAIVKLLGLPSRVKDVARFGLERCLTPRRFGYRF